MKRLKQVFTLLLITMMVFSGSISDASMLAVYAAGDDAQVEESASNEAQPEQSSDAQKEEEPEEKETEETEHKDNNKTPEDRSEGGSSNAKTPDNIGNTPDNTSNETANNGTEKLEQREIKANILKEELFKDRKEEKKTYEYKRIINFWNVLTGRKAKSEGQDAGFDVIISGKLPEGITAEAGYILLDDGETHTEKGLFSLDITLYDRDGNIYISEEPVKITVKDAALQQEISDDNALIAYIYREAPKRAEDYSKEYDKKIYAADVSVYRSKDLDKKLLSYEAYDEDKSYKDDEDAVRFTNDKIGLEQDKDSVTFEYDYLKKAKSAENQDPVGIISLVVTSQMATRKLSAQAGKNTFTVSGSLAKTVSLQATEITKKNKDYSDYVEKTAEALNSEMEELSLARAFDIQLIDPETGEEFQPDNEIKVSIKLADEDLDKNSDVSVVHFTDGKDEKPEVMDSTTKGNTVKFSTDSFSVYVITTTEGGETITPQCNYTFWIPDKDAPGTYKTYSFTDSQGKTIYDQTVTSGNELIIPQVTSTDTEVFAGWYKGEMVSGKLVLETEPYDFDNITITENSAVALYAVYKNYAMVIFHDQYDSESRTFPIAYTRRAALETTEEGGTATTSATVKISDLSTRYIGSGGTEMAFSGWSETPITIPGSDKDDEGEDVVAVTPDEDGCITVTGEKHLYPIFIETHLLSFYAAGTGKGAAYNGPRYINEGEYLENLPTTSLIGYTFTGWFTGTLNGDNVDYGTKISDSDGNLITGVDDAGVYVYDGKLYLRDDTTLYAGWEEKTKADYKILYWQQNGTGSDYIYKESLTKENGTVGETVSVSAADKANDRYRDYHLKEEPATAEVKADGSTVLNVYYDHNEGYQPTQGTFTLTFADSVTGEGKASSDLPISKSVDFGAKINTITIPTPSSGRKGYEFDKWFLDPYGNEEANLDNMTMPDQELTLYAGWKLEWYVVSIDPNYGELRPLNDQGVPTGTGSTWFWQTIEREPIAEYTYVERNYVESSSGTYYYVYHPGDGKGNNLFGDRYTYYTQDMSKATEDTTFEYSPGTYTYAGWYEVMEDGTEVPFVFGERTDHNTNLILHWKKNDVYYLKYNAEVDGLNGTIDDANGSHELLINDKYADCAVITLTHSAKAPSGYTFIGWKVRGSSSSNIYTPGHDFTIHAEDAKRASGKNVVNLDAVYVKVDTASIKYNANDGTVGSSPDLGQVPKNDGTGWDPASGTVDEAAGIATVSGLTNNSKFKLSGGTGFTAPSGSSADFLGWSDKAVCDDSAKFYSNDQNVTYGVSESNTLYAVWGVKVSYHLNSGNADWGGEWDPSIYSLNDNVYSQTVNRKTAVSEPTNIPVYTGTDGLVFRYWATRTGSGTDADPYKFTEYDFSKPVTGKLELYAYWAEPTVVIAHAVDASEDSLKDKTNAEGWTVNDVKVSNTETELNGTSNVTAPENYDFAFVAVASDLDSISKENAVTAIKYEDKKVKVKYNGDSSFRALGEDRELFFVYYEKKALNIGYKSMEASGVLDNVITTGAPETTVALLGEYVMSDHITDPLSFTTGFTNYAFAIGSIDPGSETQMNASNLSLITNAVGADDTPPTLRVRNTWRGFEYATETGENVVWTSCGYEPQLYVIYYTQQPTVVMFNEKTVGTSAVMNSEFVFNLLVTQVTTTTVSVQTQVKNTKDEWENSGDPEVTTTTGPTETIYDTTAEGNQPYILKNGEANSSILFYSSSEQIGQPVPVDDKTQTITTTTEVTAQTAVITQTLKEYFTTSIDGTTQNEYTYTANGSEGTKNVTFTNTHKELPVEVHVAMVNSSGIAIQDNKRSDIQENYKFDLELGKEEKITEKIPSNTLFTGDSDDYAFGAIVYGTSDVRDGSIIDVQGMDAVSIAYEQKNDNIYELVLKDSEGNSLGELGGNKLYYLYYPMPKIRYVKEAADGSLSNITGCLQNPDTGVIEPSNSVTYSHKTITMNEKTVEQEQSLEIPPSGLTISQEGNNFRMPPILDDSLYERYLSYKKLGAGRINAASITDLDVSDGLTMQLKVQNNRLKYSFDGTTWNDLQLEETPTIYAIYSERGYDLQISKTVDMSQSGENPLFSGASFTVEISSASITKDSYEAEGADSSTVDATPAEGTTPGKITLNVVDGTTVRIKGLGRGDYTVRESGNDNFTLTAKIGPIVGGTASNAEIVDNSIIKEPAETEDIVKLDSEKKIDITNSPKAICKIGDNYFYTLRSMVDYVDQNIATKKATAEMLTDYAMPKADTVEIPSDFNLTLTTAESVGRVAVITRTDALKDEPLFTSNGGLTLTNLTLEGSSIEDATKPMIQSAGDLTIDSGATIQNVINTSNGNNAVYGGAINATDGNITVNGTIQSCSAAEGGAIYHSGSGTITLGGTGIIQTNTATSGSGGAIWLAGGTINVSGTSKITGNKAESGNGGAVYADGIVEIKIDQGGTISGNTAKEGGAIYANATATIDISETENVSVKPAVTGNIATTGDGGAIYVNGGSVNVSGGSLSNNNKAENGQGGAIYANTASVTVSGTAEVKSNTAKEGGAIYDVSGLVKISGGEVANNTASTGNGGSVYAGSGNVTVSGGSLTENTSTAANGGAIYADTGNVAISGGTLSNNIANANGGAVYAGRGNINVSVPSGGTAPTIQNNKAETGKGGALFANNGAVSISDITLDKNTAGSDGGAVYAGSGTVTLTNSTFGGDTADDGNTAGGSGGAIYAGSGNVTVSGGSMKNNKSTNNGGAIYVGSGAATMSTVNLSSNSAANGNGGAIYLDNGSLSLTTVTANNNSAVNGAAVFTNNGRATFSAGSYMENVATNGGAVGVGSTDARLVFNGNVQVKDNTLVTGNNAPKSNVYLDKDDDAVINIDKLGTDASIGIYVPDTIVPTRSVPGARFAIYTDNSNANKITNDRYSSLTVQSDTAAKKLFWSNGVRIEVMYKPSYSSGLPNGTSSGRGTTVKDIGTYDPMLNSLGEVALSELAADVYTKYPDVSNGLKTHPNATFGSAFYYDAPSYEYDISKLIWNREEEKWQVKMRNGETADLLGRRIYVIYSEPAYISIENNTDDTLTVENIEMTVNGTDTSVINSSTSISTSAGYGMVFAKNGAIRTALLPITKDDLKLTKGQSVSLLIPGGQNMSYKLDGEFATIREKNVRLRRGEESSLIEETAYVKDDGKFDQLTGTSLNSAGTYHVIFGDDKIICKVIDKEGTEHPYSKISAAINDIIATTGVNPPYELKEPKTATIQMVTDYLLTASDDVNIPQGYDITLTTASKTEGEYKYTGEGDRAIISRDTLNTDSMIKAWNALESNKVTTTLRLNNLIIDGKSVRGLSDGGAVATQYTNVYIDTVDFKNVYASNGGALLVMFNFDKTTTKNTKHTVAGTILQVNNSDFTGCTSTTTVTSNRLGGGAIVTNAETMGLNNCDFDTCTAVDQAGAVFHRIDYNDDSWTNITGCTFTNCSADAAGGLELDSMTISVTECTFEHCVAKKRNGGGFNVWALNKQDGLPTDPCWVTVTGCTFNDCQLTTTDTSRGNGGGFRSNAVYNTIEDCIFTNNTAIYGGGISLSNTKAETDIIRGCTFERCTATGNGGGVYSRAKKLTIEDYTSGGTTKHTEVKNCTSKNDGGGIYNNNTSSGTEFILTNANVTGNEITGSGKSAGGVFTNARKVTITGATITDNTCTSMGGGLYANTYTSLDIKDSDISRNTATGNGGGVCYYSNQNNTLTIKGSTIDGNTSTNGKGGGIYTEAKTVTISDSDSNATHSSISANTSKANGGGIYQNRNVSGSKLEISNASINGNTIGSGTGGGICAVVYTLTAKSVEISRNTSTGDGGGIWFDTDDTGRPNMKLIVEGSTLDTNISGGNGGGIYTQAKTVEVKAHKEGTGEVTTKTTISNGTAAKNGGGIYQNRDIEGSSLMISDAVISNNNANGTGGSELGGGGVYANVRNMTLTDSEVKGNTAAKHGGGIYKNSAGTDRYLVIDHSKVMNNTAGNQGGGIYDCSQLTLRNSIKITGNRLTTNNAENCAGVYLVDNRTVYIGPENASEGDSDTIIVRGNTTANNTLSDMRLWWDSTGSKNHAQSVYVYCNLTDESEIRIVNAAKAGTQFGSAKFALTQGFSDDKYVFIADNSTLHGITDRTDPENKTIIWAGPPIAKLTDGNGRLLFMKYYEGAGTYPAIFDRLDTGDYGTGSIVSPFSLLRMEGLTLYYKDGSTYSGDSFCIKMLVERYETSADMTLPYKENRTVTFTTADTTVTDEDPYRFEGRTGGRSTVIRGKSVASSRTLINVRGDLNIENIVIDGGAENGITLSNSTRCIYIDNTLCTVTLGENAVLQNGNVNGDNHGGGVFINTGKLDITGGVIRNCAAKEGGGVYVNGGVDVNSDRFTFTAGSIYQCSARTNGGGVRAKNGSITMMSGSTIYGCSAVKGGGVYVPGNVNYPMKMNGGLIINNTATQTGGGIAFYDINSRLYLSGKVNISGNTCNASVAMDHTCNVELDRDSNDIINTYNGGLLPGAYIGVYVNGAEGKNSNYDKHGVERKPFGTFATADNTTNLYSFVNDRNGLKGGIIEETDSNYQAGKNRIYWIQIFALEVTKDVVSGESTQVDPTEIFMFKVIIRGKATVTGQLNAADIDSTTGEYGEMIFHSNGRDATTAIFGLTDGQKITGVNLSEGLTYEVIEYMTVDQAKRYAAMPMNGYNSTVESLVYGGETYQVIKVNTYASTIGENKTRTDVDPYTSALKFKNLMPVCKITDKDGNILYQRYDWDKVTNKTGEGADGGRSTNQPYYYAPAVYTELSGDNGAFKALEGTLYRSNGSNPTSYAVSNGVKVEMVIAGYSLKNNVEANTGKVTLTTASSEDTLFPKQDAGATSTISRAFAGNSMFNVSGNLTFDTIILDGVKDSYTVQTDGGIAEVMNGGNLTIRNGAKLQNSKTAENHVGGAVYVADHGTATITGGTVNHNESVGDGAGIYLAQGARLNISGNPDFGGTGTDVSGNITKTGNLKDGKLVAQLNGGKSYSRARQDIYIAGYESTSDDDTSASSLVVNGDITSGDGTIWIWADEPPRYKALRQFAKYTDDVTDTEETMAAFRNARGDTDTGADQVGQYLYGVTRNDDTHKNVFWYGIEGSRRVILRKVISSSGSYESLENAVFTVYPNETSTTPVKDKNDKELSGLQSNASGAFYAGELNYGDYYVKESSPNQKTFIIHVNENGVGYEYTNDKVYSRFNKN